MPENRLKEIAERESKAVPGPWGYDHNGFIAIVDNGEWGESIVGLLPFNMNNLPAGEYSRYENLGIFIAHAREDIPYLLGLVGRMRVVLQVALTDCISQGWDDEPEWMSKAAALLRETEE